MDGDLTQWMKSVVSERTVEMIIECNAIGRHPVKVWIPQGSPVSPILCAIYTSGLLKWVEVYVSEAEGLSLVDGVGWMAPGRDVNHVISMLER